MAWSVEFVNEAAEDELRAMPRGIIAIFLRITALIESAGPQRLPPLYVKHLEGSIWELRMKDESGIARAAYVTASGQRVVVLHVFSKKTQKTPLRNLELARKRAKELK